MTKKIAFVIPYPFGFAPSQRFRFEQYIPYLKENGFETDFFSFLSFNDFMLIYEEGKFINKLLATLKGFLKRFVLLFKLSKYDIVFIHREASPIGPPFFEWFITKVLKKKTIYDFDDAIWLKNTSESNKLISNVKSHSKVEKICTWSTIIFCGNEYLKEFAKKFNQQAVYIPTTIDTNKLHNEIKKHNSGTPTIGWTGTHTTAKYLQQIDKVLIKLQQRHGIKVKLICNKDPKIKSLDYDFIKWRKETEISDLLTFDIGIMPLTDNEWSKGKCGFKALQYMALGIPSLVSPIGVNKKIISHGVNGFIVNNSEDWEKNIEALINNPELRSKLGEVGRKTVIENYSIEANKELYISHFNQLVE